MALTRSLQSNNTKEINQRVMDSGLERNANNTVRVAIFGHQVKSSQQAFIATLVVTTLLAWKLHHDIKDRDTKLEMKNDARYPSHGETVGSSILQRNLELHPERQWKELGYFSFLSSSHLFWWVLKNRPLAAFGSPPSRDERYIFDLNHGKKDNEREISCRCFFFRNELLPEESQGDYYYDREVEREVEREEKNRRRQTCKRETLDSSSKTCKGSSWSGIC